MINIYITNHYYGQCNPKVKDALLNKNFKLHFNPFKKLLSADEALNWAKNADAIICATEPLTKLITESKKLKIISKIGVGLDNIPIDLCRQKSITVAYTPDAVTQSTSELTVAQILNLLRHITTANNNMHKKKWDRILGREISETVIGIIGWGRIGQRVSHLLKAFNPAMILINDPLDFSHKIKELNLAGLNIKQVSLEETLKNSDVITLHADLNHSSKYLININNIKLIKPGACLINIARGSLVEEDALLMAFKNGYLKSGAFDTFENEPYTGKLADLADIILTSHMGSFTYKSRLEMDQQATMAILNFFASKSIKNIAVSPQP